MAPRANCPTCQADLKLTSAGTFDSWICPRGHGLAATLSELYERAQEDEIHRLWQLTRQSEPSADGKPCPMCQRPMASVVVPTDGDEAEEGTPGDGTDTGEVPVDVCSRDEVIWFDVAELDAFPADVADLQPTAEQEAALAEIRRTFGEQIAAAMDDDYGEADELADRIITRMGLSGEAFRVHSRHVPSA